MYDATVWETEDKSPGLGLYVRDTNGLPHILAAVDPRGRGWYCLNCPIENKALRDMLNHVPEHLKGKQI